jgi:hypothetical protein
MVVTAGHCESLFVSNVSCEMFRVYDLSLYCDIHYLHVLYIFSKSDRCDSQLSYLVEVNPLSSIGMCILMLLTMGVVRL